MSEVVIPRRSYVGDFIVLGAMSIVAAAVVVGLVLEAGLAPFVGLVVGGLGFLAAATSHVLLRRSESVQRLKMQLERSQAAGLSGGVADATSAPAKAVPGADDDRNLGPALSMPDPRAGDETAIAGEDGNDDEAGLARLRLERDGPVDRKASRGATGTNEINGIIRQIADDIATGRKLQDGVSIEAPPTSRPLTAEDFGMAGEQPSSADAAGKQAARLPHELAEQGGEPVVANNEASAGAGDKLAAIAEALSNERIDVYLEPIHGLADGQARHYEVTIRLTLGNGEELGMSGYSEASRGSALLPLIDAVKVSQAKKVGLQLLRRGQSGALISEINGSSVAGAEFGEDMATIMGVDQVMAGRLVLSFSQHDLRGFNAAQWDAIDRLGRYGFRFAMSDVTDLDMDFEMLAHRGFAFAKLDAEVFVSGLPTGAGVVPPSDVCRYLASAGLTLIVDRIRDERRRAEVLGFGALFGQGEFFGAPRPVKAEVIRGAGSAESRDLSAANR